ncbi:glutathione S-transferase family protein [Pseudomaricurvus alkylphenolicus]|uniref:glutathione S-transferase N-terminal domain-containing protein n=1 Tax=Pseudomaricurvus alkylphenolicus TaxID=1306991 RepID=UPI001424900C|nr:glutathione S-transferase family protein [Pseudomaricurvus alkylphenolicus]
MNNNVTLYTHALSPYGLKVFWALIHKRIPFDMVCVSPPEFPELSFTGQTVVPVLKVAEEWRLDSTPLIHWLDEIYTDISLTDHSSDRYECVEALDNWVTETLIPVFFRHLIDGENFWNWIITGIKLASTMNKTTAKVPKWMYLFWGYALRRAEFLTKSAAKVNHYPSLATMNSAVIGQLEKHIGDGPFMGGHERLTIADISTYAQIYACAAPSLPGTPDFLNSTKIRDWVARVESERVGFNFQPIYPGAPEFIALDTSQTR